LDVLVGAHCSKRRELAFEKPEGMFDYNTNRTKAKIEGPHALFVLV
jgi:hypothetical protein